MNARQDLRELEVLPVSPTLANLLLDLGQLLACLLHIWLHGPLPLLQCYVCRLPWHELRGFSAHPIGSTLQRRYWGGSCCSCALRSCFAGLAATARDHKPHQALFCALFQHLPSIARDIVHTHDPVTWEYHAFRWHTRHRVAISHALTVPGFHGAARHDAFYVQDLITFVAGHTETKAHVISLSERDAKDSARHRTRGHRGRGSSRGRSCVRAERRCH
mmetsp:Transcript_98003/g.179099  ORF Transcript_98003/g.179099 Transcript_98003/m.179099 type:complete len:218 (+) Transcript_98003:87-740(+)